ncbi:MAG: hypothetical protein ABR607_13220 [Pyrinomonadaceae bacterium]
MKKITETIIETKQVTIIRRLQSPAWCCTCAQVVQAITPELAAQVAGFAAQAIYREAEQGAFHLIESIDGQMRLCFDSVLEHVEEEKNEINLR